MYLSEFMIEREEKKRMEKEMGQPRYRLEYKAQNWFYQYEVQEFFFVRSWDRNLKDYSYSSCWSPIRKFRSYEEGKKVLDELEAVNGYIAKRPDWF